MTERESLQDLCVLSNMFDELLYMQYSETQ